MSEHSQFTLLGKRRFGPFFATQALGAFTTTRSARPCGADRFPSRPELENVRFYAMIAPAVFILPFFLFSATAGQIAEKFEKTRLIRYVKLFEIAAMLMAVYAFHAHQVWLLFVVLFLMGLHSTAFGPIKYAILPQALRPEELVGGNGLVEMGTSMAVLIGMMAGGSLMALGEFGTTAASLLVVGVAVAGYLVSRSIPLAPASAPDLKFNWNPASETLRVMRYVVQDRTIFNAILGISWFWFFGTVFTAQLPAYTQTYLGGGEGVLNLTLALFSVGVGIGSLLCERLSGHKVEIGLVPFGSIGMSVFAIDLYFARPLMAEVHGLGVMAFIGAQGSARIVIDLMLIGLFAGLFIVPLFALVQSRTERSELSRVIAGNNILNALFMVVSAGIGLGLTAAGFSIPQIFLVVAVLNAAVAIYIYTLVPEFLMRFLSWLLINTLYRIRTEGLDHIPERGPALLVCNHVSYMDALIVAGSVRRPARFVMYYRIFRIPVLSFIFRTARAIPIASAKEDPALLENAFAEVDRALAAGELVCIFPEGGLTSDGEIATFRRGVERILERRPVPVVPMAIRGLWGSIFSRRRRAPGRMRLPRRIWSRLVLAVGAPVPPSEASAAVLEQHVRELRGAWA